MRFRKERQLDWMRLDSALKKNLSPYISAQTILTVFDALDECEKLKLPDNVQMHEHSWPCQFHIIICGKHPYDNLWLFCLNTWWWVINYKDIFQWHLWLWPSLGLFIISRFLVKRLRNHGHGNGTPHKSVNVRQITLVIKMRCCPSL